MSDFARLKRRVDEQEVRHEARTFPGANAQFTLQTRFAVPQSSDEVFAAINNPRRWRSAAIDGDIDRLGAEWHYRHRDVHRATFRTTDLVTMRAARA